MRLIFILFTYILFLAHSSSSLGAENVTLDSNPPINALNNLDQSELFPVAVIDSGISYNDPKLAPYILRDENGSIVGWDYNEEDSKPFDGLIHKPFTPLKKKQANQSWGRWIFQNKNNINDNLTSFFKKLLIPGAPGHGTHVSGIALNSCRFKCGIIPIKLFGPNFSSVNKLIESIEYAVSSGAKVVNMSLAFTDKKITSENGKPAQFKNQKNWDQLRDVIKKNSEILFIVAAGNSNIYFSRDKKCFFPACINLPNIITVGAVDNKGILANFTNYDPLFIDLYAPGVNILSNWLHNSMKKVSGTSMSTPYISGLISSVWRYFPHVKANTVKTLFLASISPQPVTFNKVNSSYTQTSLAKVVYHQNRVLVENKFYQKLSEIVDD